MALIGWHTQVAGRSQPETPPIFLLGMTFVGCLVLVLGARMFWPAPAAISEPWGDTPILRVSGATGETPPTGSRDLTCVIQML
jgi:hypothetical protein